MHRKQALLQKASLEIDVSAPIAITRYSLEFANKSRDIIEGVYHFPLPVMASLMGTNITINGETFSGKIASKDAASEKYEDGIAEGKRSVLIESIDDGLYQINLGNLAPSDTAIIELTIATVLTPKSGYWQYRLPTVIAPKYSTTSHHILPTNSAVVRYKFTANMTFAQQPELQTSSHQLVRKDGSTFAFGGTLDKDVVINFALDNKDYLLQGNWQNHSYNLGFVSSRDVSESVGRASNLHVLVDCSGSMAGPSINQVRLALRNLATKLDHSTGFNLYRFGTRFQALYDGPKPFSEQVKRELNSFIPYVDADMGGTEIVDALKGVMTRCQETEGRNQILLLTDGQAWWEKEDKVALIRAAHKHESTIHSLAIGHAADAHFLNELSTGTGGSMTMANPSESVDLIIDDVVDKIRHRSESAQFEWQGKMLWSHLHSDIFNKVPTFVVGASSEPSSNNINLTTADGCTLHAFDTTQEEEWNQAVVQLGATLQLASLKSAAAENLAQKLQLLTRYTSYVMVSEEAVEGANGAPALQVVPQMDSFEPVVMASMDVHASMPVARKKSTYRSANTLNESAGSYDDPYSFPELDYLDVPEILRRQADDDIAIETPHKAIEKLHDRMTRRGFRATVPGIDKLIELGISEVALKTLKEIISVEPDDSRIWREVWLLNLFETFNATVPEWLSLHLANYSTNCHSDVAKRFEKDIATWKHKVQLA